MRRRDISMNWFKAWETGALSELPIHADFVHCSPYGMIQGKSNYLELVHSNKDKFLGHRFEIEDLLEGEDSTCIRYIAIQGDFKLEVTEWHYFLQNEIIRIVAYYNIPGEINEDRKLIHPE
jgi:hypothetical protein